jgi:hypothetical protein
MAKYLDNFRSVRYNRANMQAPWIFTFLIITHKKTSLPQFPLAGPKGNHTEYGLEFKLWQPPVV